MAGADELVAHLERLESKLDQMESAASRTKAVGRLMTLIVGVAAVSLVLMLLAPIYNASQNTEKYTKVLMNRAETRIIPALKEEGQMLVQEMQPAYAKALEKIQETHMPKVISVVENEYSALRTNVLDSVTNQVGAFQAEMVSGQVNRMKKEFPQLQDQDNAQRILERAQMVAENVAKRIVDEFFSVHFAALQNLETTFRSFEVPSKISNMSDVELWDHTKDLFAELLSEKFNVEEETSVSGRPAVK